MTTYPKNTPTSISGMTVDEMREYWSYDPETGELTNLSRNYVVTAKDKNGYIKLSKTTNGRSYQFYAHRVAWLMHHGTLDPKLHIDHINGDPSDNRIENLRLGTVAQNMRNRRMSSSNTSGVTGVTWNSTGKSWVVHVSTKYYGSFQDFDEAAAFAKDLYKELGYGPNHGAAK